ncbi:MAG: L,D-transpeptidase [Rhizobiaceae bacterium]
MKSRSLQVAGIAISLALFQLYSPAFSPAQAQAQQGRYAAPGAVVLSPDISGPWVLQLRRNQAQARAYIASLNRAQAQRTVPTYQRPQAQRTVPTYSHPWFQPRRASAPSRWGVTPLGNDQARRSYNRYNRYSNQYARVQDPLAPPTRSKRQIDPKFEPQIVRYETSQQPGTIVIDTNEKFLYLVEANGMARRYGVGVGKPGFEWAGTHNVTRMAEWPSWRPPAQMIAREKKKGRILPSYMEGGPENPLGARALYLGSTLYRVHGTNQPWTIGKAVSSGCIRMRNEDVMDLYERVDVGTKVIVS